MDLEISQSAAETSDLYFYVGGTVILLIIFAVYLWFVFFAGPKFMKDRRPYKVTNIIRAYNIFQVVVCSIFVTRSIQLGFDHRFIWKCESFDWLTKEELLELKVGTWLFMLLRMFEFIETFFFILRKKENQASFLHVYHHITVIALMWVYLTCDTGESSFCKRVSSFHGKTFAYFRTDGNLQRFYQLICACRYVHVLLFEFVQKHQRLHYRHQACNHHRSAGSVCTDPWTLYHRHFARLQLRNLLPSSNSQSLYVNYLIRPLLY